MNKVIERKKHVIDATEKSLGRLASEVAQLLRGKHKVDFKLHIDMGDFVEVTNIDKLKFTGNKYENDVRYRHSQYPGGLKTLAFKDLWEKDPEKVFKKTVQGMLPKNRLASEWIKRLTVTKNDGNK